jgi:hypothetical protein
MSWHPGPTAAFRARRCDSGHLLTLLVALVVLLQLPAPPTCAKRVWRFTAVPFESVETESDLRAEDPPAAPGGSTVFQAGRPEPGAASAVAVWSVVPIARLNPVLDAGTTRAPPLT